jgi:hypothetical protein
VIASGTDVNSDEETFFKGKSFEYLIVEVYEAAQ